MISDVDYPRYAQKIIHLWASFFSISAKITQKIGVPTWWRHNSVMSHRRKNSWIWHFTFSVLITIQKSDRGYISPFSRKKFKTDSRLKKSDLRIYERKIAKKRTYDLTINGIGHVSESHFVLTARLQSQRGMIYLFIIMDTDGLLQCVALVNFSYYKTNLYRIFTWKRHTPSSQF